MLGKNRSLDAFVIAIFLSALDIGVIAPSLTVIVTDLGVPVRWGVWVIALHLAVLALALPLMEIRGNVTERKRWFVHSLVLFAAGSVICGSSESWMTLIAGRMVQALGAGGVVPFLAVEVRRMGGGRKPGRRVALHLILAALLILMPVISSWISWWMDWRWLFWINLPAAWAVYGLSRRFAQGGSHRVSSCQISGIVYFGGMLLSAMVAVSRLNPAWGWSAPLDSRVLPFAVLTVGLSVPLMMVERQSRHPFFAANLWVEGRLLLTHILSFLAGFTWVAVVFIPGGLVDAFQVPPAAGGVFLSLVAAASWSVVSVAVRTAQRWGALAVLAVGFLATTFGYLALSMIQDRWGMVGSLLVLGWGLGFTLAAPIHELLFQWTPTRQVRTGLLAAGMFRAAGGALGLVIMALSFYQTASFPGSDGAALPPGWRQGFETAMLLAAGVSVIGLFLSLLLPSPEQTRPTGRED